MFLPQFDIFFDQLLNRRTTTKAHMMIGWCYDDNASVLRAVRKFSRTGLKSANV